MSAYGARLDVPGLEAELDRLHELAAVVETGGAGRTAFVAGPEGSGRTALLTGLERELRDRRSSALIVAGGMQSGRFTPRPPHGLISREASSMLEAVVTATGPLHPVAALAAQLMSQSKAAWRLVTGLRSGREFEHPFLLLPRLLRAAAGAGPVVLLIDDADGAPGAWWTDLVLTFGAEIARQLPVLVVLAVDGPEQLGPPKDADPEMIFAARRLTQRSLAEWIPMPPVSVEELRNWVGGADAEVVRALRAVTLGRSGWGAQLWEDWRSREVVDDVGHGRWRFCADGQQRALSPVGDLLTRRLAADVGARGVAVLDEAREVLACAALEGRRFTVDAVALGLARDRDDVIDFLDEGLTGESDAAGTLLVEAGHIDVEDEQGARTLWLSRFATQLDWLALRHHGLTPHERRNLSAALAGALERLYGTEVHRVAPVLAALFEAGGNDADAARFRRMSRVGMERDVLVWRAERIIESAEPTDPLERQRAGELLLAAAEALYSSGPFPLGVRLARAARRTATGTGDRAYALYLDGCFHACLRDDDTAREQIDLALSEYRDHGDLSGAADARYQLAAIDVRAGRYQDARTEFLEVLEVRRSRQDTDGEATVYEALAEIAEAEGDVDGARENYVRALELIAGGRDRHHEGMVRYGLATLDVDEERYDAAADGYRRALALIRESRDLHGESLIRSGLGLIAERNGDLGAARREYAAVADLCRAVGDAHGESINLGRLALIDVREDDLVAARERLLRALAIQRRVAADPELIADLREGLEAIESELAK